MISQERLRALLNYNHETGIFTWSCGRPLGGRVKAGAVAGDIGNHGYWRIYVDGRRYQAHRLAWFYVTGKWPTHQIDHINLARTDNRFCNLREATNSENLCNTRARCDSGSGIKCIHKRRGSDKWRVVVTVDGKKYSVGDYATVESAKQARDAAVLQYHGEFARTQ